MLKGFMTRRWQSGVGWGFGWLALGAPLGLIAAPLITNLAQLRAVPFSQATQQLPVRLSAIVTAFNPNSVFIQDATGGSFLSYPNAQTVLAIGDYVEVEGVTYPGRFLTGVGTPQVRQLGKRELPAPMEVDYDDLVFSRYHYERVAVRGIVHSLRHSLETDRWVMNLTMGRQRLEVQIASHGATNLPPWVGAKVRVTGLAGGNINNRRQLLAPQLLVNQPADVRVETPPVADPFAAPLLSASELLNFRPEGLTQQRVRVRGIVTLHQPDGVLFLRDGQFGLLVETDQLDPLKPGDEVEAVGFAAMGRFSAYLEDARFRVVGSGPPPPPQTMSLTQALTDNNDANLIVLQAYLVETLLNPKETTLMLRIADVIFSARLPRTEVHLRNGSELQVAGVCRVVEVNPGGSGFGASPRSIELLLRSGADINVLSEPSGWTVRRLAIIAGALFGLALLAFGWVVLLRRRVADQAQIIRAKVQREAVLEERHRVAREMHDTLAQSFSGLGFQLEALQTRLPAEAVVARQQLETAQKMVRHGQEDFRRSLLNLRPRELDAASLATALAELAEQSTRGTGIEIRCDLQTPDGKLSELVETNLLRIAQESLVNAVHHGHPRHIQLSLEVASAWLRLTVIDDGQGFDPRKLENRADGHFGWRGIRERAGQMDAQVELQSTPGQGTTVRVNVPL